MDREVAKFGTEKDYMENLVAQNIGSINAPQLPLLEGETGDGDAIIDEDSPEYENQLRLRQVL